MKVDINEVAPCRSCFTITMAASEVDEIFEKSYIEVTGMAQLKGFRKGHVPRRIIERKFGDNITEDVKTKLFQKGFFAALKDNDISPLSDPDIKLEELTVKCGKEFKFSTEVDIRPKFELADYKDIKLVEEVEPAGESEIDERLNELQARFAEHQPTDKPAKENNLLEGDVVVVCEDEEILKQQSRALKISGTELFGIEIGNLVEKFAGALPGDKREVEFTISDSHFRQDLQGKNAKATLVVEKVLSENLPEINDDFAKRLGIDDVATLRKQLKDSIEQERRNEVRQKMEEELIDKLLVDNTFAIPESLKKRQAEANLQRLQMNMLMMGKPQTELEKESDSLKKESEESADRAIRRMIIFDAIAEKEDISVSEAEIQMHINQLAQAYRTTPKKLLKDIEDRQGFPALQAEIKDIKITQLLLDAADITKKGAVVPENQDSSTSQED